MRVAGLRAAVLKLTAPRFVLPASAADTDYRLPALLLCDLERQGPAGVWVVEAGPDFLCLGADNKLYQARLCWLVQKAGPQPSVLPLLPLIREWFVCCSV